MPGSLSSVECHPQQSQIDAWIYGRRSVRWIAAQTVPPVSPAAIQRYRKNLLAPALKRLALTMSSTANLPVRTVSGNGEVVERPLPEAVAEERANPFMERHQKLWGVCWKSIQDAQSAVRVLKGPDGQDIFDGKDFGALTQTLNQAHRNLELLGKATGVFGEQQTNTVLVVAAPGSHVRINAGKQPDTQPDNLPDSTETILDLMPDEYQGE